MTFLRKLVKRKKKSESADNSADTQTSQGQGRRSWKRQSRSAGQQAPGAAPQQKTGAGVVASASSVEGGADDRRRLAAEAAERRIAEDERRGGVSKAKAEEMKKGQNRGHFTAQSATAEFRAMLD